MAREMVEEIVDGIPKHRRRSWRRYKNDADEIFALVLATAKRVTDLKGSDSSTFETWHKKLDQTQTSLERLVEMLASATSVTELSSLDENLQDVTEVLTKLRDREKIAKEVTQG
jgi:hypothetical protein